jgi:large subunit ribosomal protein L29
MTKPAELRLLADTDRAQRLDEARRELFNLRFQLATGRLDNLSRIAVVRREIARLLTLEGEESPATQSPRRPRRRRG